LGSDEGVGALKYVIDVEGKTFDIVVGRGGRVWVNDEPYTVDFRGVTALSRYSLLVDYRSYEALVERDVEEECRVVVAGRPYRASLLNRRGAGRENLATSRAPSVGEVQAPLPGLLVGVPVAVGQRVTEGDVVAVLESMKMNLELHAPWSGVVQALHGTLGTEVGQGEVLAVVKLEGADETDERS
jgi:biotin carboxyl carrier protein